MGLTRSSLWQLLEAAGPVAHPLLVASYEHATLQEWKYGEENPHGMPWATSFHASSFPGDDPDVCGRKAVYELVDAPSPGPITPFLQAMFDIGSDVEHRFVSRIRGYGALLSADVTGDDSFQTGFVDEEHWLTGNVDAIILPRGWRKSHIFECKTTSHEKVLSMLGPTPSFPASHGKYVRQLKTYIGLARELPYTPTVNICDESGAIISAKDDYVCPIHNHRCAFTSTTLLPPDDGTLLYASREDPMTIASFRIMYDPEHMRVGRARLAAWRDHFLRGEIPPHPYADRAKKWTSPACKFCDFKAAFCKSDEQEKILTLADSNLIGFAKSIRPDWDYEEKRSRTLFRWQAEDLTKQGGVTSA